MPIRPMTIEDAEASHDIAQRAFTDLAERSTQVVSAPTSPYAKVRQRYEQVLATDPAGCWVAEERGEPIGAVMAIRRDGLWGLSLLAVEPGHQSAGAGGELLRAAHASAHDADGRVILASADHRALRAYTRLGLALEPVTIAHGAASHVAADPAVRPGTPGDTAMMAAVDTLVRGAAHGDDIAVMQATGAQLLVYPERGYVMVAEGDVRLLAARDDEAAAALLRSAIAGCADAKVMWMTAAQQWGIEVAAAAGLRLELGFGAVMRAGRTGTFAPYLPNGTFL